MNGSGIREKTSEFSSAVLSALSPYCTWLITHTSTHSRLTAIFPELPRWAGTRKVKPIWILLEQETVSGNGISWAVCKSAPRSRQITTPALHHSVFTVRMPFVPPNQQRQSTKGRLFYTKQCGLMSQSLLRPLASILPSSLSVPTCRGWSQ